MAQAGNRAAPLFHICSPNMTIMKYALQNEVVKEKRNPLTKQPPSLDCLVSNAWLCAYASLWKTDTFSEKEIKRAKELIREYLLNAGSPVRAYNLFCQRVLITYQYLQTHTESYVPLPSQWLDRNNNNGFAGTKKWMEKVLDQRSSLPFYRIELKAFAEALLELATEPSCANFIYWKQYFTAHPDLLNLFLNTVALQQFQSREL